HVCLEPEGNVQIFDCVEFSRGLRCADVASDVAFLLMDLTRLDAPALAAALVARYRAAGVDLPGPLLRFYRAHRALVRAKTACLSLAGATAAAATAEAATASDYLDLAGGAALTTQPLLIAMTGLSGTGKSTVARRLARALGASAHASDIVRKELARVAGPAPATWESGIYDRQWTEATYQRLFALAAADLAAGKPVILDAAFLSTAQRRGAAEVAARGGARLLFVETVCDEATATDRIAARLGRGSASDATAAIYRRQRAAMASAPPDLPPGAWRVQIDTEDEPPGWLEPIFTALAAEGIVQALLPSESFDRAPSPPPPERRGRGPREPAPGADSPQKFHG
ncbi:MAG TPA: AAA family ATPase, partial [Thermomicrobiales bacterium]|nr:AAA family ATPase [Thermomicrobiales bacterium]